MKALTASLMRDFIRDSVDPDVFDGVINPPLARSPERPLCSELGRLCCALAELAIKQYAPRRWSQRMIFAVGCRLFLHFGGLLSATEGQTDDVAWRAKQ